MIRHPENIDPENVVILQGDIQKIHEIVPDKNYLGSYEMFCTVKNKSWDIKIHFKTTILANVDKKTKHKFPYDIIHSFKIASAILEGETMNTFLVPYGLLDHYLSDKLNEIEDQFVYDSIYMLETDN
ncbi:hypothetical protein [Bacillus sp. BML-BC060]|uniref:hypothetical protein n=1 Tax=Bacillus sp. BML-BC060 TaxID=2842487 RepID=UPI001C815B9E|nr:hypothetical protein [Bacillus sp. BML-BC060]